MKIKKKFQGTVPDNKVLNIKSESETNVYSCKYINDNIRKDNNYSTEERCIGTWIDGKPLYRKVFYMSDTTTGEKSIDISSLNYEFIMIKNQYFKSKNYIFTGNRYNVNTPNDVIEYFITDNTKQLKINVGTPWTNFETYIVVEYTKTTD